MNLGAGRLITTDAGCITVAGDGGPDPCTPRISRSGRRRTFRSGDGVVAGVLVLVLADGVDLAGSHSDLAIGTTRGGVDTVGVSAGQAGVDGMAVGTVGSTRCTTECDSRTWRICTTSTLAARCRRSMLADLGRAGLVR